MENKMITVLDHGFVRLVDNMGNDLSVVRAARVSYDAAWRAGEDEKGDAKLINYLWKNKHTTPFETVTFTFEVKAPIFVLRQWMRHRMWTYNELSARYKELPEEFYVPNIYKIGTQSKSSKQARVFLDEPMGINEREAYQYDCDTLRQQNESAFAEYHRLLERGWPRELARTVLPVATYSHMFATVNLLNLLKFLSLRSHDHAQYEIRIYADAMLELIKPIVPVCIDAYLKDKQT